MRYLSLILLSLTLSSCWAGTNLYSVSDAGPAIPPGVYEFTMPDEPPKVARVTTLANGMTQFDWGEEKESHGFAPLEPAHGTYVTWDEPKADPSELKGTTAPNQFYMLMVRQSNGDFVFYPPQCTDAGADVARKAGATIEQGTVPICIFPTRASLEAALRLVPRDDENAMKVKRIP